MSFRTVDLCVSILEDHFGFYVSLVGSVLLREQLPLVLLAKELKDRCSLREVRGKVQDFFPKLPFASIQMKRSLVILEQHNLLKFEPSPRGVLYSVSPDRVLHFTCAPRAILIVKTLYNEIAEAIFEDILAQGHSSCSETIRRVSNCLDNTPTEKVNKNPKHKLILYLLSGN